MTSKLFSRSNPGHMTNSEFSVLGKEAINPNGANKKVDIVAHTPAPLRFCITDAAVMLQMSRAQLYNRIREGSIKVQKDGNRTYITQGELERYVASCEQ